MDSRMGAEGGADFRKKSLHSGARCVIKNAYQSGCSAAGLAHLPWEQGVGGSNPLTPTNSAPVAQPDRATAF